MHSCTSGALVISIRHFRGRVDVIAPSVAFFTQITTLQESTSPAMPLL